MIQPAERNILVIGAAGYIGSVLVRKLLGMNYKVTALDNLIYNNGSSLADLYEKENFQFIYGDFGDEKILQQSLVKVTDVILLAALVGDPICKKYPELAVKTNQENAIRLFEQLNNTNIKTFIFTSTCSNYGLREDDTSADEESDLNPQSLYASTKVFFEKYIIAHAASVKFSPVILRLSTAYGSSKRMRFDLTVSEFTRELALNRDLLVYDETTWRPYCHTQDISDAIIKVIESPEELVKGEIFNVGSNTSNYTKKMIVDIACQCTNNYNVHFKTKGFDPRNYRVSFDKIRSKLNFNSRFLVEDTVPKLVSSIRNGLFDDVENRMNFYGNYEI
ncbi:hypothetical protein AC481_06525 [miscellaneous Crenarchaeota group archaeon SMTZ-80]|nr:MAG: hypothetical protein AC481_06525 [miscellaneous Crenarchaeota group archaeon SMTZ-80]